MSFAIRKSARFVSGLVVGARRPSHASVHCSHITDGSETPISFHARFNGGFNRPKSSTKVRRSKYREHRPSSQENSSSTIRRGGVPRNGIHRHSHSHLDRRSLVKRETERVHKGPTPKDILLVRKKVPLEKKESFNILALALSATGPSLSIETYAKSESSLPAMKIQRSSFHANSTSAPVQFDSRLNGQCEDDWNENEVTDINKDVPILVGTESLNKFKRPKKRHGPPAKKIRDRKKLGLENGSKQTEASESTVRDLVDEPKQKEVIQSKDSKNTTKRTKVDDRKGRFLAKGPKQPEANKKRALVKGLNHTETRDIKTMGLSDRKRRALVKQKALNNRKKLGVVKETRPGEASDRKKGAVAKARNNNLSSENNKLASIKAENSDVNMEKGAVKHAPWWMSRKSIDSSVSSS